jgi:ATP-binding cassette subfamily B protein
MDSNKKIRKGKSGEKPGPEKTGDKKPGITSLLTPYRGLIVILILLSFLASTTSLLIPKIIAYAIDGYTHGLFKPERTILWFVGLGLLGFIFTYLQSLVQTYASEKVARDLRSRLSDQISRQSQSYIDRINPNKLLTYLTSDVDSIKLFVSQAIVSIASSIFIIIGVSVLLLTINWKLGLAIIAIIPLIGTAFFLVLRKVRTLFLKSREIIDSLNKVINESIIGSALIRVLNSQQIEFEKFLSSNEMAKSLGLSILKLFAGLIPVIIFIANLGSLTVLLLGGHFVIGGSMSLGEFTAFNSYLALIIFPILIIGFMSNVIAAAGASYGRISEVLNAPPILLTGTYEGDLVGKIDFQEVTVNYGQKPALKQVNFSIQAGSKVAIIGPTAAGKSQLLYLLTGLTRPSSGKVLFDGREIEEFNQEAFHRQVGFVFQDSILFNMSLRENIAFSDSVTDQSLEKAIETSELKDFIDGLPEKLNTLVSERGTSLSGGQKQRIMLARALAINPKVLLLDDFTARVDSQTEKRILENVARNYPGITLISVTQKISSVEHYDQILVLMQGEIIARGTHAYLLESSPEYVQIFNSQQSTSTYELQS